MDNKISLTQQIKKPVPKFHEPVSGEKVRLKNKLYRLKIHGYEKKRTRIVLVYRILHIYVNESLPLRRRIKKLKK